MANTWSNEQKAIFKWFKEPDGSNLVVEAYAGTGKSTTIGEAVNVAPEQTIIVSSFTSSAVEDLKVKITNPNVDIVSLHGVGNRAVKRYWEKIGLDKTGKRAWNLAEAVCGASAPDAIKRLVSKLGTKAREITPYATAADELIDIALQFDCVPDDEWKTDGYDLLKVCDLAVATLDLAAREKPTVTGIDFADMLFLPLRNKWLRPTYDLGVLDETQDTTFTQLALFQGVVRGRIAIVGDRRQAIFAFRGADSGSMDRLTEELKPATLKLSTTYRCGKAIVKAAQKFVPDYKAYEGNSEGLVNAIPQSQIYDAIAAGNWVLSRTNAPLVGIALGLVRRGRRVRIQGKDIGAGLKAIVNKCAKGPARNSVPKWLERLSGWKEKETTRAAAQKSDALIEKINDQYETLIALVDGVAGIPELLTRLDTLFDDKDPNGVPQIVCSSVHKAKGREADRVFLLDWTFGLSPACQGCRKRQHNCKCEGGYVPDPIALKEEQNIEYVAITRARNELTRVSK